MHAAGLGVRHRVEPADIEALARARDMAAIIPLGPHHFKARFGGLEQVKRKAA